MVRIGEVFQCGQCAREDAGKGEGIGDAKRGGEGTMREALIRR